MIEELKEHLKGLKAEARLEKPSWYVSENYDLGHWEGRTGVLNREIKFIEQLLKNSA